MKRFILAIISLLLTSSIGYCQEVKQPLTIKSDKQVYEAGEDILLGMDLPSDTILYGNKAVISNTIPFDVKVKTEKVADASMFTPSKVKKRPAQGYTMWNESREFITITSSVGIINAGVVWPDYQQEAHSFGELQSILSSFESGSSLYWTPYTLDFSGKPLLFKIGQFDEFEKFCQDLGIELIVAKETGKVSLKALEKAASQQSLQPLNSIDDARTEISMSQCVEKAGVIKVGTTRADIEKIFDRKGRPVSVLNQERYVLKDYYCEEQLQNYNGPPRFKDFNRRSCVIDVTFKPFTLGGKVMEDPDLRDSVIEISKPRCQ
ncbi:MAG: hypothetical protein H6754_07035 [Candidatus Omnitrophica bacterium]|nr:hypothetical protein [Candidatus Omnitrophota bacterium]